MIVLYLICAYAAGFASAIMLAFMRLDHESWVDFGNGEDQ